MPVHASSITTGFRAVADARTRILHELKIARGATRSELASRLGVTSEAVRQQLETLIENGWVRDESGDPGGRGRPARVYRLTEAAEAQFPKFHDALTVELLAALDERFGDEGVHTVLAGLTDKQVGEWLPRLAGKPLRERIEALRGLYFDDDPFTEVRRDDDGAMLVEHNCPYLAAATGEPRLCSVTISTMKRLLGVAVERTERFQNGDGRCVFRIREDRPVADGFRFDWEPDPPAAGDDRRR